MTSPGSSIIAHIDMDAFFASIEVRDRPELRDKPVVVAGDRARAVVAAASYPARRYGVRSAMPVAEARRLCPELITVASNMEKYRRVSGSVMELLSAYSDRVEIAGLDEAYLDLSTSPAPKARARAIKIGVRQTTGLTCSIGLGPNKLIAKIASDQEKPDGLCHLTAERFRDVTALMGVRVIPGVGPKTAARLESAGVITVAQLAGADAEALLEPVGSGVADLISRAKGIDDRKLETSRIRKSESRECTFERDIADRDQLNQVLDRLARAVIEGLDQEQLVGRTATVKVRFAPFVTRTRSVTVARPFKHSNELVEVGTGLLRELLAGDDAPVRLIGIAVSSLQPAQSDRSELALF